MDSLGVKRYACQEILWVPTHVLLVEEIEVEDAEFILVSEDKVMLDQLVANITEILDKGILITMAGKLGRGAV